MEEQLKDVGRQQATQNQWSGHRVMLTKKVLSCSCMLLLTILSTGNFGQSTALDLPVGFNISARSACVGYGAVIKANHLADGHDFFAPFLGSSTFNGTDTSDGVGFALGFLFVNSSSWGVGVSDVVSDEWLDDGIYLAVCGGMPGTASNKLKGKPALLNGVLSVPIIANGYVTPMWIANRGKPLKSVHAALVTRESQVGTNIIQRSLQLQDYDGQVKWSVDIAGMLEMQDSGNFVVYDSLSKNYVTLQSKSDPVNVLIQGQKLLAGMSLTSKDGRYSAHMNKGGLVLVLNNVQIGDEQSAPYWIFPIHFRNDTLVPGGGISINSPNEDNVSSLIASSPCTGTDPDDGSYGVLGNASLKFFLEAGSCSLDPSFQGARRAFIAVGRDDDFPVNWSFLSLENDGRLYINAVVLNSSTALPGTPATVRIGFDNEKAVFGSEGKLNTSLALRKAPPFAWGACDEPMACGPLGVCATDELSTLCSCPPSPSFYPINKEILSQGCVQELVPNCTSDFYTHREEDDFTLGFLEMENIASILLFSGWEYASSSTKVDHCKEACASNCSCMGFFYNKETSDCFFVQSFNFSLTDQSFQSTSLFDLQKKKGYSSATVNASIYSTYLKQFEYPPYYSDESSPRGSAKIVIAVCVPTAFVLSSLILMCCCKIARRRKRIKQKNREVEEEELQDILPLLPRRFSYKDLQVATNHFSKLLGAGGCGSVYAGVLSDGEKVAVKVLECRVQSGQSKQFLAEVATVGRTNHVNVVRLVGFCWENSHRLLVYEFLERGSLDQWLFVTRSSVNATNGCFLDWPTRYNVALGIVRGLSYLHGECAQPVLHFDIKPQNILLDEAFEAKLADFGMSRLMQRGVSEVVTVIRGTPGYIAPEWLAHGAVSKKSDVYSMGMVFLEIVAGRKNVDLELIKTHSLVDTPKHEAWHFPSWAAKKCEEGSMMELVDERLHACGFHTEQVKKLIHVAFWCIQDEPSLRPHAATVLQWLQGDSPVKQPPFQFIVH